MKHCSACFLVLLLVFGVWSLAPAGELVVKTYPDGIRDDGIAYLYQDRISTFSFYLFNADSPGSIYRVKNPVEMGGVKLFITLPKGMDVVSYGIVHSHRSSASKRYKNRPSNTRYENMKKVTVADTCTWELACGEGPVRRKFRAHRWGTAPAIASLYHIYVYLEPQKGFARDAFDMPWTFKREADVLSQGTAKVKLLPGPTGRKNPKRFTVWTGLGYHSRVLGERELEDSLKLARECGVTGIKAGSDAFAGWSGFTEMQRAAVAKKGFTLVDGITIRDALIEHRLGPDDYPEKDENYHVNLYNLRVRRAKDKLYANTLLWCPTMMATPKSEIFGKVVAALKQSYQQGFRYFLIDLEKTFYSYCFCGHCRKSFAGYLKADEKEFSSINPWDLIHKYTLQWYKFRCWQTGNFFKSWKDALKPDCPEIMLGLDAVISYASVYTKDLGFGMGYQFPEDPRFTDFGLDFHVPDVIKGGMLDIINQDLWFRPQDNYGVKITKPIISKTGAFCNVNWNHFCTLSGKAWSDANNKKFGCDKRGELLKLGIANRAALGVEGVVITLATDITDALITNEADKGMAFVAEFEDMLLDGERLDDQRVQVYNLTTEPSPYHKIGPKSYYDRWFFYGPARRYGFVQYKAHRLKKDRLVSLFNWDFYQTKKLLVKIPGLEDGAYYVHVYNSEKRYLLGRGNKKTWSKDDLRNGVSLDLQGGGVAGIYVSEAKQEGYAEVNPDPGYSAQGKSPIDLYAWREPIPANPTTRGFDEYSYNRALNRINNKRGKSRWSFGMGKGPKIVPAKYLKQIEKGAPEIPTEPLGSCPFTKNPPQIDGKLDDETWRGDWRAEAAVYTDFRSLSGTPVSPVRTEVYLTRDSQYLYVAFRCEEPRLKHLRATARKRDTWDPNEDAVEVVIEPDTGKKESFHFLVNARNTVCDERFSKGTFDKGFNARLETAVGLEKGAWVCELKIPFKDLGQTPPANGDTWRINFGRRRAAHTAGMKGKQLPLQHVTWTGKGFRQAGTCAPIRFVGITVQTRLEMPAKLRLGTNIAKVIPSTDNLDGKPLQLFLTHWDPAGRKTPVVQAKYPVLPAATFAFPIAKPGRHTFVFQFTDQEGNPLFQTLPIVRWDEARLLK